MEIAVITASVVAVVASVIVALQIVLEIKSWSRPLPPAIVRKVFPEGKKKIRRCRILCLLSSKSRSS